LLIDDHVASTLGLHLITCEVHFAGASLREAKLGEALFNSKFRIGDEGRVPYWS
jgi:hypothetical protein